MSGAKRAENFITADCATMTKKTTSFHVTKPRRLDVITVTAFSRSHRSALNALEVLDAIAVTNAS